MRGSLWATALLSLAFSPWLSSAARNYRRAQIAGANTLPRNSAVRSLYHYQGCPEGDNSSINKGRSTVIAAARLLRGGQTSNGTKDAATSHMADPQNTPTLPPNGDTITTAAHAVHPSSKVPGSTSTVSVLGYFALWYALNVWYNIVNKRVLNALALPVSVAVAQLGIGSLWVSLQWAVGARAPPGKLAMEGVRRVAPVAMFHGGGQLATVLSLGAGAVSFTHVVKAMEPFFAALVAAVWFRQVFRAPVYVSLLPVVAGVSLACLKGTDTIQSVNEERRIDNGMYHGCGLRPSQLRVSVC